MKDPKPLVYMSLTQPQPETPCSKRRRDPGAENAAPRRHINSKAGDRRSLPAPDFLCEINILRIICWKIPSHPTDKIKRNARHSRLSLSPPSRGQETASPPVTTEKFPHYFVWGAVCKADTDINAWTASESFKSLNYLDFYVRIAILVKDTYSRKATDSAVVGTQVVNSFSTWE